MWTRYITVFVLMITVSVQAGIRDHLKKAEGKLDGHRMRNVDFIYMINLDQRPEKFAKSMDQLAPYGICPYRFSAVNGWELSLEDINDVGVKFEPWMPTDLLATTYLLDGQGASHHEIMWHPERAYFCHCTARGTIGIFLSHLSILQDAYDSGYETIWVMEDDVYVCKDPNEIPDIIDRLDKITKKKWDILFTDRDIRDRCGEYIPCTGYARRPNFTPDQPSRAATRRQIGPDLRSVGARYGAHSMILRRSGIKKILDFVYAHSIFLPYDMEWQNIADLRMFTVLNDVVTNLHNAISDNGAPYYKEKK